MKPHRACTAPSSLLISTITRAPLHGTGVQDAGKVMPPDGQPDIRGDQAALQDDLGVEGDFRPTELLEEPSHSLSRQILHSPKIYQAAESVKSPLLARPRGW